eukprot:XP_001692056.1 predicted protein [Chlamydomonas reinhardtii]
MPLGYQLPRMALKASSRCAAAPTRGFQGFPSPSWLGRAPASTAHQRRTVLPYGSAVARPPQARRIDGGRCFPTAPLWQGPLACMRHINHIPMWASFWAPYTP